MAFGTGCVKVTPAHDPNDFLCGQVINFLTLVSFYTLFEFFFYEVSENILVALFIYFFI